MTKRFAYVLGLFLGLAFSGSLGGQARSEMGKSPTQVLKDVDKKLDAYCTEKNCTETQLEKNRQIKQEILRGTCDMRELSRIALARHWEPLTLSERDDFTQLVIQLLEERAIFAKEQAMGKGKGDVYHVTYKGDTYLDAAKSRVLSQTLVRIPKEKITIAIDYKLRKAGETWKIYDIIVDKDASLVENYRYMFNKIIVKDGYGELVHRMKRKLAEFQERNENGQRQKREDLL